MKVSRSALGASATASATASCLRPNCHSLMTVVIPLGVPNEPPDSSATDVLMGQPAARPERLRVLVTSGPDKGRTLELAVGTYTVGKAPSCELPLKDSSVSRRHLEIEVLADGLRVRDLESTNGSFFQGARFDTIKVGVGAVVVIGQTELRVAGSEPPAALPPSGASRFGELLGASAAMRQAFALLERVAAS